MALVTGQAASGMGRATAHLFADEGARVAVVDLVEAGVERVVEEIVDAGGTAAGYVLDVGRPELIEATVADVRAGLGPIDIVVNNAGMVRPDHAHLADLGGLVGGDVRGEPHRPCPHRARRPR